MAVDMGCDMGSRATGSLVVYVTTPVSNGQRCRIGHQQQAVGPVGGWSKLDLDAVSSSGWVLPAARHGAG
eukprot:2686978-Alexandrium_andersonii.AAC.1